MCASTHLSSLPQEQATLLSGAADLLEAAAEEESGLRDLGLLPKDVESMHVGEKAPVPTDVPPPPVFVSRTPRSVTIRAAPFLPIVRRRGKGGGKGGGSPGSSPKRGGGGGSGKDTIAYMVVYGKPAGAGTDVSLNNDDFPGTGVAFAPPQMVEEEDEEEEGEVKMSGSGSGSGLESKTSLRGGGGGRRRRMPMSAQVVTISGLTPNESYVFAVAAYNAEGDLIGGSIGRTSDPVTAACPLPLFMCWTYLARAARQAALDSLDAHGMDMGLSDTATRAATVLYNHFVRRQPPCALHEGNPLNAHQLDVDRLRRSSMEERLGFVHAAITLVTYPCHDDRDIDAQDPASDTLDVGRRPLRGPSEVEADVESDELSVSRIASQRDRVLVVRRLMLATIVASSIGNHRLLQRTVCLGHAHLTPILALKKRGSFILPALVTFQQALRTVPYDRWNDATRRVFASLSFEVLQVRLHRLTLNEDSSLENKIIPHVL